MTRSCIDCGTACKYKRCPPCAEVARAKRWREYQLKHGKGWRHETIASRAPLERMDTSIVDEHERPKTRGECEGGERPCPFVSCRYHLFAEPTERGGLTLNHPGKELWEIGETCALDVADDGGKGLIEIADLLRVSRERIRQVEARAIDKVKRADARLGRGLESMRGGLTHAQHHLAEAPEKVEMAPAADGMVNHVRARFKALGWPARERSFVEIGRKK